MAFAERPLRCVSRESWSPRLAASLDDIRRALFDVVPDFLEGGMNWRYPASLRQPPGHEWPGPRECVRPQLRLLAGSSLCLVDDPIDLLVMTEPVTGGIAGLLEAVIDLVVVLVRELLEIIEVADHASWDRGSPATRRSSGEPDEHEHEASPYSGDARRARAAPRRFSSPSVSPGHAARSAVGWAEQLAVRVRRSPSGIVGVSGATKSAEHPDQRHKRRGSGVSSAAGVARTATRRPGCLRAGPCSSRPRDVFSGRQCWSAERLARSGAFRPASPA